MNQKAKESLTYSESLLSTSCEKRAGARTLRNPKASTLTLFSCFSRTGMCQTDTCFNPTIQEALDSASKGQVGPQGMVPLASPKCGSKYVALGDSYSSGEGLAEDAGTTNPQPGPYYPDSMAPGCSPNYYSGCPASGVRENHCHRHPNAYGPQFSKTSFGGRFANNFAFFACSGATTENNVRTDSVGDEPGFGETAQVNRSELSPSPELVSITVGGNDLGFAKVMKDCAIFRCSQAIKDSVNKRVAEPGPGAPEAVAFRKDLKDTFAAIKATTGSDTTVVDLGFPRLFPLNEDPHLAGGTPAQHCAALAMVDPNDQDWMNDVVRKLRNATMASAEKSGIHFSDALAHFENHEICGAGQDWINSLSMHDFATSADNIRLQGQASFHPNPSGHLGGYKNLLLSYLNGKIAASGAVLNPSGMPENPAPIP